MLPNKNCTMINQTIKPQSKPKSIFDMTPFELSEMDRYQTTNRGFEDDDRLDTENFYYTED